MNACDVVLLGVGGQGVLTVADLLTRSAFSIDVSASLVPTKGMAQRGGAVKAEVRLGRAGGARIAPRTADIVLAMERSEALRALDLARPGGTVLLYDHVWLPAGALLGRDEYPSRERVVERLVDSALRVRWIDPATRPTVAGRPATANIVCLGALCACWQLAAILDPEIVERVVRDRWPKAAEANAAAFQFGFSGSWTQQLPADGRSEETRDAVG